MKTTAKIVPIGNSRGIRLPKKLLDELQWAGDLQIETRGNELVITPAEGVHKDWEESAKAMHRRGDDSLLLGENTESAWDETQWQW